jgi:hypothetical protein
MKMFFIVGLILRLRWFCLVWLALFCVNSMSADSTNAPQPLPWSSTEVSYICDSTNAEPTYQDLPVSQWIQTKTPLNPKRLSLTELLTLKQVSNADDWGTVNFELPINYDTLTNECNLDLGFLNKEGDFVECCYADCERATNGNCLVWWNINYDQPGKHDIRARLSYGGAALHWDEIKIVGPALRFYSPNVCWFPEGSTLFDSTGASLEARLREQTATYRIELQTIKGQHIKTIIGSTTNSMIDLEWNLTGERGRKFKDNSFIGLFYVTYPDDVRSNAPAKTQFNRIGTSPSE